MKIRPAGAESSMQAEGHEINSRFAKLCERALKKVTRPYTHFIVANLT